MLGALFLDKEVEEVKYILKSELEDLLHDITDDQLHHVVRRAMEERYQILFKILKRFASREECIKYVRTQKNIK